MGTVVRGLYDPYHARRFTISWPFALVRLRNGRVATVGNTVGCGFGIGILLTHQPRFSLTNDHILPDGDWARKFAAYFSATGFKTEEVLMRKLALIAIPWLAVFVVIAFTFWQTIIRPINELLAPATVENARKDMVSATTDAVILTPFVTGDVPRLIRGKSLQKWSRNLWFTSNTDARPFSHWVACRRQRA